MQVARLEDAVMAAIVVGVHDRVDGAGDGDRGQRPPQHTLHTQLSGPHAIDKGAPVEIIWNQARHTFDPWYVLKGAANRANAMKFIAFAMRPENQAEMAKLSGNAPTNPKALDLLPPALARTMPTWPDNFKLGFEKGERWWIEQRPKWIEACTAGLLSR